MSQHTAPDVIVQDFATSCHEDRLKHLGPLDDAWKRGLSASSARVLTVQAADGTVNGGALLTARSAGAYVKISSVLARTAAHREQVIRGVLDYARQQGLACIKWEMWTEYPELFALAEDLGFQRLPAPRRTGQTACPAPLAGYVHWLNPVQYIQSPHYQQSESFTCAAVAALVAHQETSKIDSLEKLRIAELALWRQATNFMACEPIELGLALTQRWPQSLVSVWLDTDQPVMVDYYSQTERDWRGILQRQSRLRAETAGLAMHAKRLEMSQISDAVANGAQVLLLVSLEKMLGFDVPHWILCHGIAVTAQSPVLIVEDSWVNHGSSESWVDATSLPITLQELDAMSVLEDGRYRAALVLAQCADRNRDPESGVGIRSSTA